jgi:hypothetical protein
MLAFHVPFQTGQPGPVWAISQNAPKFVDLRGVAADAILIARVR